MMPQVDDATSRRWDGGLLDTVWPGWEPSTDPQPAERPAVTSPPNNSGGGFWDTAARILNPIYGIGRLVTSRLDNEPAAGVDLGGFVPNVSEPIKAGASALKWVAVIAIVAVAFFFLGPLGLKAWAWAFGD